MREKIEIQAKRLCGKLIPLLENEMYLLWRRHQIFTPIAQKFLEEAVRMFGERNTHGDK